MMDYAWWFICSIKGLIYTSFTILELLKNSFSWGKAENPEALVYWITSELWFYFSTSVSEIYAPRFYTPTSLRSLATL